MDSSPGSRMQTMPAESIETRPAAGEATRKPSLLPAFEPLSSSPFPRPQSAKRKFEEDSPTFPKQQLKYYPTPVPTSSTGIVPSSPNHAARQGLQRTISTLSERMPLGDVPSVDLPANGEVVRMGRSGNSSDYRLSANRLISRVHVQAAYHAPTASNPHGHVEIECLGWNGAQIHCRGVVFELQKGESYVSENPEAEIMLDVQDTRVLIVWPAATSGRKLAWDSEDDISPSRRHAQDHFASSPPMVPRSPVSQSPIRQPDFGLGVAAPSPSPAPVQVFEDPEVAEDVADPRDITPTPDNMTFIRPDLPRSASKDQGLGEAKSSMLSSFAEDDFSDGDEENDPVVHSFGPFGENILPRFESISAATPTQSMMSAQRPRKPLHTSQSPQQHPGSESLLFKESPVKNHVINQLAFSRLHSQPLSIIHGNLPAELRACLAESSESADGSGSSTPVIELSKQDLKQIMDNIPCVGEIPRSGKDAAGKQLENEFYYVPEMDTDQMRRDAVTNSFRGTGLRNVRKQHKQYYWKRPRV